MKIRSVFLYGSNFFVAVLILVLSVIALQVYTLDEQISQRVNRYREGIKTVSRISELLNHLLNQTREDNQSFPVSKRVRFFEIAERIENHIQTLNTNQLDEETNQRITELHKKLETLTKTSIDYLERANSTEGQKAAYFHEIETLFKSINHDLFQLIDRLLLTVESGQSDYRKLFFQVLIAVLVIIVLVMGFGLLITGFSTRRITKPLKKLIQGLGEVAEGNYHKQISVRAASEIHHLVDSFNKMSQKLAQGHDSIVLKTRQLQRMSDEISNLNLGLEHKVEERSRELVEIQNYLKQIIYAAPVAIAVFDRKGIVLDCNIRFVKLINENDRNYIIGSNFLTTNPLGRESFSNHIEESFKTGVVRTEPVRILKRWFIHNFCPIVGKDGATVEVMVFSEDVTEVITSRELADQKNLELQEFVYSVSHDLKSPLFSLRGFLSILKQEFEELANDDQRQILSRLDTNITEVERRITDLLELSRVNSSDNVIEEVDIPESAKLSALTVRSQYNKPEYHFSFEGDETIRTNKMMFNKLLDNFISNSFKYRHPERPLNILLKHITTGPVHQFVYEDNGMGIDDKDLPNIFKVFYRSPHAKAEGTGIGLTIVKKIIESLGGTVTVESVPDQFTRFRFTIEDDI